MGNFDIRTGNVPDSEKELEKALRPLSFSDFRGQKKIVEITKTQRSEEHTSELQSPR